MKIYISGKITGNENYKQDFARAEKYLRKKFPALEIVNPVNIGSEELSWEENMRICIKTLVDCDFIYMLKNFGYSRGAKIELNISRTLDIWPHFEEPA